jgi:hypothetical protein
MLATAHLECAECKEKGHARSKAVSRDRHLEPVPAA